MLNELYFDNNGTTPLSAYVIEALKQSFSLPLNASASHNAGRKARKLLEDSRELVASSLDASPKELFWCSGGTEAINLALFGLSKLHPVGHIISSESEHSAVLSVLKQLEKKGWQVSYLRSDEGRIRIEQIEAHIKENTRILCFMAANNETGVLNPIEQIAHLAKERNLDFFVDAVAAFTKSPIKFYPGITAMAFSGHKFHAPTGIGFVLVRQGYSLEPLIFGGGQEGGLRSGTVNLSGVIGVKAAVEQFMLEADHHLHRLYHLRELFETILKDKLDSVHINGCPEYRAVNTSNLYFEGVDAELLLIELDQAKLYASQGSACSSGSRQISHVLRALNYDLTRLQGSLRFSFSRLNTPEEIEMGCDRIIKAVNHQRDRSGWHSC